MLVKPHFGGVGPGQGGVGVVVVGAVVRPSSEVAAPRVLLVEVTVVDARQLVALGVRSALAGVPGAERGVVVGRTARPLDVVRAAVAQGRTVVVLLDDADQTGSAVAALEAGAMGVALLDAGAAELVEVVRAAGDGRTAVARAVLARLDDHGQLRRLFTAREQQVLAMYATGLPAKSVARRMAVSEGTVKTYLKRLREKARLAGVAVETKLDLAVLARRLDLL